MGLEALVPDTSALALDFLSGTFAEVGAGSGGFLVRVFPGGRNGADRSRGRRSPESTSRPSSARSRAASPPGRPAGARPRPSPCSLRCESLHRVMSSAICSSENLELFMASPCAPSGKPERNRTLVLKRPQSGRASRNDARNVLAQLGLRIQPLGSSAPSSRPDEPARWRRGECRPRHANRCWSLRCSRGQGCRERP